MRHAGSCMPIYEQRDVGDRDVRCRVGAHGERTEAMIVKEFVEKAFNDMDFLREVLTNVPGDLLKKDFDLGVGDGPDFGHAVGNLLFGAAEAMGHVFDKESVERESKRLFDALSGFGKVRFTATFIRTLAAAKEDKGQ